MSYMPKIQNLYKQQDILLFKKCYAMEKIHGTNCKINWNNSVLTFSSGGVQHQKFKDLFDTSVLMETFLEIGHPKVTIYGEGYGGKMQRMSSTYGKELKFVAFEVKVGDIWLSVPQAENVCNKLELEFVHYVKIPATLEAINEQRDADSVQAIRNGMGKGHKREGIVIHPLMELRKNNDERIIVKHKRDDFKEMKTTREVSPEQLKILSDAKAIADEWCVPNRLEHILQDFPDDIGMEKTKEIIQAMVKDIHIEAKDEIIESIAVDKAIGRKTAQLLKSYCKKKLER